MMWFVGTLVTLVFFVLLYSINGNLRRLGDEIYRFRKGESDDEGDAGL